MSSLHSPGKSPIYLDDVPSYEPAFGWGISQLAMFEFQSNEEELRSEKLLDFWDLSS